jgi:hypothetical protein
VCVCWFVCVCCVCVCVVCVCLVLYVLACVYCVSASCVSFESVSCACLSCGCHTSYARSFQSCLVFSLEFRVLIMTTPLENIITILCLGVRNVKRRRNASRQSGVNSNHLGGNQRRVHAMIGSIPPLIPTRYDIRLLH